MKRIGLTVAVLALAASLLSVSASAASFGLRNRVRLSGDSTWYTGDLPSAGDRSQWDLFENYVVSEQGFEIVGHERCISAASGKVSYSFGSSDSRDHYVVCIGYNVSDTLSGMGSGFSNYMPVPTDDSGYVYSYTKTFTPSGYSGYTMTMTVAVWQYPSEGAYNTVLYNLDWSVPGDEDFQDVIGRPFYTYFPVVAPKIESDKDAAVLIAQQVADAIDKQTEEMKDYLEGESRDIDYNTGTAEDIGDKLGSYMDKGLSDLDTMWSNMDFVGMNVLTDVVKYFQVPFIMFSGAITTVAVIYFVQRVLL